MESFMELTKQIKYEFLEELLSYYESEHTFDRKNHDHFAQVKQLATPWFELIEIWEDKGNEIVHKIPVFPNQLKNTKDNMEIMILHSLFQDVRRKRYMELYHSCHYVFDLILEPDERH